MPQTLSAVREIIDEIQDFALLPTVDFFEAKYYIHTNQNKDLALDYYNKAINGSELLNDKSFRDRVIEEKIRIFHNFNLKTGHKCQWTFMSCFFTLVRYILLV